jgi:hypothetical protein
MNTFCVLPWFSREINNKQTVACCLLPKNHDIELIKTDLLDGIRNPACSACWDLEDKGKASRRQIENTFLDYKLDRDISLIQNDCKTNNYNINLYQITTSNLCNQACVSCSSNFSTKWSEIDRNLGNIPIKNFTSNVDSFDIDFYTAKRITLLGGEPLFDSTSFSILKKLIDSDNTNCFVSFVTNGSINLSAQQLDLLSKFSDLNICVSIDGIGPVFEYMRWPGKWKTLTKNLDQYRTVAKEVSVSYTISSLNALYYDQTVDWFKENNLDYNHNIVSNPNWLSLKNMPVKLKHQLANKQNFVTNFSDISGLEISTETISQHIKLQDRAKKIDIKDYMPEFWHLLND